MKHQVEILQGDTEEGSKGGAGVLRCIIQSLQVLVVGWDEEISVASVGFGRTGFSLSALAFGIAYHQGEYYYSGGCLREGENSSGS